MSSEIKVSSVKAKDGTAGISIADSTGNVSLSGSLSAGTIGSGVAQSNYYYYFLNDLQSNLSHRGGTNEQLSLSANQINGTTNTTGGAGLITVANASGSGSDAVTKWTLASNAIVSVHWTGVHNTGYMNIQKNSIAGGNTESSSFLMHSYGTHNHIGWTGYLVSSDYFSIGCNGELQNTADRVIISITAIKVS